MSKIIGAITTGAGVSTVKQLDYVPERVLIGDINVDLPIQKFVLEVDGDVRINLPSQAFCRAFSQWRMEAMLGADVQLAQTLKLGNGRVNKSCIITIENAGATTPAVYANSDSKGGRILMVGTKIVQGDDNKRFGGFLALFFDPTNLAYAEVTFKQNVRRKNAAGVVTRETRNFTDQFTTEELKALYAEKNQGNADGLLGGLVCIDNLRTADTGKGQIVAVTLYASGGDITVLQVK